MIHQCADGANCLRTTLPGGGVGCPDPFCNRDFTSPSPAETVVSIARTYPRDANPDVRWLCDSALRVLDVVAAHEAAAEGQPLGWAADIRNAFEGEQQ